ncbi:5-methyltetrahydrofolate--homocysteine methyltransferase [Desulfosporosinus sp. I2]|uniref:corrinoid protein n=1 Tax=Desulfosporosinus sp. I2 TaxID=1617025 RepID=UPI0005F01B65|nr:corrinoid protein [Desulfosporosinus sp. I2]KJR44969.1 5-methyltetrahydrofolate--homocysteine methyltransferase [Desulfosporosinus sp. I2]
MAQKPEENEILACLHQAVISFDIQEVEKICHYAIEGQYDIYRCIFEGLVAGMEEVGRLYEEGEYFVPEMLLCADALYAGLELLRPHLKVQEQEVLHQEKGQVIIGVVSGDIHDIGKNIVRMMFDIAGFTVWDLGRDVPLEYFIKEQEKRNADIICLSSMMSTTALEIKHAIRKLKERFPNLKILVGGAPLNETLAARWGADSFGRDAAHAVKEAIKIIRCLNQKT